MTAKAEEQRRRTVIRPLVIGRAVIAVITRRRIVAHNAAMAMPITAAVCAQVGLRGIGDSVRARRRVAPRVERHFIKW